MSTRAVIGFLNRGGTDVVLLTACAFSGCPEPFAGNHGPWRLCARHLDAIRGACVHRPIGRP